MFCFIEAKDETGNVHFNENISANIVNKTYILTLMSPCYIYARINYTNKDSYFECGNKYRKLLNEIKNKCQATISSMGEEHVLKTEVMNWNVYKQVKRNIAETSLNENLVDQGQIALGKMFAEIFNIFNYIHFQTQVKINDQELEKFRAKMMKTFYIYQNIKSKNGMSKVDSAILESEIPDQFSTITTFLNKFCHPCSDQNISL